MNVFKKIVPWIAALGLIFLSVADLPEETELHAGVSISMQADEIQAFSTPEAWWRHRWWRHPWRWRPWRRW